MIHADDAATRDVKTITPCTTIREAAEVMGRFGIGFLPVICKAKVVGVVTDRDIATKGIQMGSSEEKVEKIMSRHLIWVTENDSLQEVAQKMIEHGVRRVLVLNSFTGFVGVLSVDDLAVFTMGDKTVGQVLRGISLGHADPGSNSPQKLQIRDVSKAALTHAQ